MNKIFLTSLLVLIAYMDMKAQQDPHYTQYMYNMNVINPAYAGSKESISFGLLYRKQWVNIQDAPTSFTFSGHTPTGNNVGLGLSFISDKIGPVTEQNVYGDFSYTLKLNDTHRLALGLKAGVSFHKVGLRDIQSSLPDPSEGIFGEDINDSSLNMGVGAFYYTDKYYVSLSVPNMLKSAHLDYNGREYGSDVSHYFLTAGYVFDINYELKFKPSFMLKSAFNVSPSLDVSANFLYMEKFELGATYRLEDSFGAMMNFAITPELRIGYAYDHVVSDLKVTAPSSHEFILLYDLFVPKKVSRSPRFF
ncbi:MULTISPECIES: PorP/SprF family type IX secretion system membrane protein [Flavobacterium]|uniref:Type IX secretion system membrane protein PorP/SprF n=1 Tax=Flavobacterium gawalongense TaxID=2594432 RepID=A0A553BF66_9FLAO|nr:type IX secretion system membrane protein PorP/SprF [Flavobacterium gawalongense]TRW99741.1 type IX secretion system membrane protein PorP/SprF [Flavobacterium gawalongense]TRX03872.1 type IX secretion system membrane protein PorP/SprF [Flavobacterium gawalongense]TRX06899.1 type IX secretion system membrane protein PorP/SprF [Flavobacterium gawalongense]TRX07606.1 type IX secretion system membrane protein PorP/SprF [Flavobacterium gawalongense]TRX23482.1 type IX secretion system membrane p